MTGCAYCGNGSGLTREHIWPKCIIEKLSYELRYSGKAKKIVRSDLVIKDVCKSCNNGALSALDAYFCQLYDRYFHQEIGLEQPIAFKYEYDKLARALLKISYNSARTTERDADTLSRYASVIASSDAWPLGVFIKVETIHSSIGKTGKVIPARATRCGPIYITNRSSAGLTARIVQIDGYRFYVVTCDDIFDRARAVRYLASHGGVWLTKQGETLIPRPTLSTMEAFQGIQNWRRP